MPLISILKKKNLSQERAEPQNTNENSIGLLHTLKFGVETPKNMFQYW